MLPGSGGQWLIVPSRAHPKDVCSQVGSCREREGKGGLLTTSARFTTDLAKLLVRTTDCRICSNWEKSGWRVMPFPRPLLPELPPGEELTSWWSLITISSTYLVSLCTVGWPRRTWGVGGHLESVYSLPGILAEPWTDSGVMNSSQGQYQSPTGRGPILPQP